MAKDLTAAWRLKGPHVDTVLACDRCTKASTIQDQSDETQIGTHMGSVTGVLVYVLRQRHGRPDFSSHRHTKKLLLYKVISPALQRLSWAGDCGPCSLSGRYPCFDPAFWNSDRRRRSARVYQKNTTDRAIESKMETPTNKSDNLGMMTIFHG